MTSKCGHTREVFSKASYRHWLGLGRQFVLGFDHFHVCGNTDINCPRGKTFEPGVLNIKGREEGVGSHR